MYFVPQEGDYVGHMVVITLDRSQPVVIFQQGSGPLAGPVVVSADLNPEVVEFTLPDAKPGAAPWRGTFKRRTLVLTSPVGHTFTLRKC